MTSSRSSNTRLGVLFLHSATQPPLGADTFVQSQIAAALDKTRVDVHVACVFDASGQPTPTYRAMNGIDGIHLVSINLGRERSTYTRAGRIRVVLGALPALWSLLRLAIYVRRHRLRIVHTTDRPRDARAAVLLARITRSRCIVHAHVAFDPRWMSPMLQRAIHRADAVIAISRYVASSLIGGGVRSECVHVVPNAIDVARWAPGEGRDTRRAEFAFTPQHVVLLSVSRLFPGKGAAELLRAFAEVRRSHPHVRLLIVGREVETGYEAELQRLAAGLGVSDAVVFTGQRSDVPSLMAAADIFAMPSQFEPFGLVYLEAMAMELPVVALDNGGTPEVVEDGVVGLLSAAGHQDSLIANISRLVIDPTLRRDMGRRGRTRAATAFTMDSLGRGCESVYRVLA